MDKAKQTISGFMSHNDEHKTIVDQDQRAAITEEHVRPERHEEITTAVDKEIHQDHHQTILQPIKHTEKLAEKHTHNAVPVQHKTFEHDKAEDTKALLDADAAKYRDSSVTHDTINTSSTAPTVQGEHIHHHLHQHVQPVIQKDTIAPEVVHTTIPIHETHHAPSVNHGTTTMPATTLQEFESQHGGLLKGKQSTTIGEFDGCAKNLVKPEKTAGAGAGLRESSGNTFDKSAAPQTSTTTSTSTTTAGGPQQGRVKSLVDPALDRHAPLGASSEKSTGIEDKSSSDYKVASQAANRAYNNDSSVPRTAATAGGVGAATGSVGGAGGVATAGKKGANELSTSNTQSSNASSGKVSLKDKLNPFKDADGDGKKGILS